MTTEIIQIIEDDSVHAMLLAHALSKAGYRINVASDGAEGLADVERLMPALVVLDVMLPGMDGHEICRRIRDDPRTSTIPIVMVSALAGEDHRVAGLSLGVDDYVAKPFSLREVVARVQAVLRRSNRPTLEDSPSEDLRFEGSRVMATFRDRRLQLTGREWEVLRRLARRPGESVANEELIALLWGHDGLVHEHEIDRLVRSLKSRLDEQGDELLELVPGGCRIKVNPQ